MAPEGGRARSVAPTAPNVPSSAARHSPALKDIARHSRQAGRLRPIPERIGSPGPLSAHGASRGGSSPCRRNRRTSAVRRVVDVDGECRAWRRRCREERVSEKVVTLRVSRSLSRRSATRAGPTPTCDAVASWDFFNMGVSAGARDDQCLERQLGGDEHEVFRLYARGDVQRPGGRIIPDAPNEYHDVTFLGGVDWDIEAIGTLRVASTGRPIFPPVREGLMLYP